MLEFLVRRCATPPQAGLNWRQRIENLCGAMIIRPGREGDARDRRILLVDHVLTTRATVESCAKALKKAGAVHIDVVTLARAVCETT